MIFVSPILSLVKIIVLFLFVVYDVQGIVFVFISRCLILLRCSHSLTEFTATTFLT